MGTLFATPTPTNMNNNMAPKLPKLPCFEAFGVLFCPDVCSYFCLVCGRRGSLACFGIGASDPAKEKGGRLQRWFFLLSSLVPYAQDQRENGRGVLLGSLCSSRHRSPEGPAIQLGAVRLYKNWRCTAVPSSRPVGVGVSETLLM